MQFSLTHTRAFSQAYNLLLSQKIAEIRARKKVPPKRTDIKKKADAAKGKDTGPSEETLTREEALMSVTRPIPPTHVIMFLKQPWQQLDDMYEYVLRELWGPVSDRPHMDTYWAREVRSGAERTRSEIFEDSLVQFLNMGLNQTVGLVIDALVEEEVVEVGQALEVREGCCLCVCVCVFGFEV
jgi:hypothetical protein